MGRGISRLDGQRFDVAVIGAGVCGSAAAQHLASAGYTVLLVDKGDFGSGSSSRSSRLLHCGLRYLAPGASMWDFVRYPDRLKTALRMARQAMKSRSQFVEASSDRTEPMKIHFPVYDETPYAPWQVDLAFQVLKRLDSAGVPLDYRRLDQEEVRRTPLIRWLRDVDTLRMVAHYREYRFEWPERIVLDTVMDAERMGAVVRNYTACGGMERDGDGWRIQLANVLQADESAAVHADLVLNMAGVWIDGVNRMADDKAPRRITGTKGIHFMVRLPPECAGYGVAALNRAREPIYCAPWRGLHYVGPTETLYEGDIDDVRASEDEIAWLMDEINHLLPGVGLKRSDVLFTWAGVRPLTYDPALPMGARDRTLHDLTDSGLPNVMAMTAGPIMTHRNAGEEVRDAVAARIRPSGTPRTLSFASPPWLKKENAPPIVTDWPVPTLADLKRCAREEHPTNLVDLLFRRVGVGWTETMGAKAAQTAAEAVADIMGWDGERTAAEVAGYRDYVARRHNFNGAAPSR